jgi:hypothetical protein
MLAAKRFPFCHTTLESIERLAFHRTMAHTRRQCGITTEAHEGWSARNGRGGQRVYRQGSSLLQKSSLIIASEEWDLPTLYAGEFLFSVSRECVSCCPTPLLGLMGNDLHHLQATSRELAALAPNATFIEHWKASAHQAAKQVVERFLAAHTAREAVGCCVRGSPFNEGDAGYSQLSPALPRGQHRVPGPNRA